MSKKNKKIKLSDLSKEERMNLVDKHRVKVLAKYINKHYLNNKKFLKKAGNELELIIHYELLKGLDAEFAILRDDPDDPLILELIREKTHEIIKEIYK